MNFKKLLAQSIVWRSIYFVTLFLVNVFLSQYLQAEGIGKVYYISNTFSLLQLIAGCCLESGITYFAAGKLIPANKLLWLCILWTLVVMAAFMFLLTGYLHISSASQIKNFNIPLYALCFITGLLLTNYGTCLFYAKGNFYIPNAIMAGTNLSFIIFIVIALVGGRLALVSTVLNYYFFMLLAQGVLVMAAYIFYTKSYKQIQLPAWHDTKKFYRYSLGILAANILFFFVYRVDYYFVHASPASTPADLGNYIQVSKLGQMLIVLPQIIASAVYPQMSSGINRAEVSAAVMLMARVFSFIFLIIFIGVAAVGKWVFPFVFGNSFQQMQLPLLLLLPGVFCLSVLVIMASYFSGKGNVRISIYAALAALVVVLVGDYFLVPVYGIYAAAFVSTIGYAVNLGYYVWQFKKDYQLSVAQFFKWRKSDWYLVINMLKNKG